MAEGVPWDDQTDAFITGIDESIASKYDIKLRDILLDPTGTASRRDAKTLIKNVKDDVNSYFSTMLSRLEDEQKKFNAELESATLLYQQINSEISRKALAAKVPFISSADVERKEEEDERIVISQYSDSIGLLIDKMLGISDFAADLSIPYKNYKIGSWLFSGRKNYLLMVNPPTSRILDIGNSSNIINSMLDNIASAAK